MFKKIIFINKNKNKYKKHQNTSKAFGYNREMEPRGINFFEILSYIKFKVKKHKNISLNNDN